MVWGASSWNDLVGRFDFFSAGHGAPDTSSEDQNNYAAYSLFKTAVGRSPSGDELSATVASGQGAASYIQTIKQNEQDTLDKQSSDTAKKATSSFLAGFTPYASLAPLNLSPSDAADIISLEQSTQSNQLGLTATQRAVNGAVLGDTNNSSLPGPAGAAGAAAGPIVGTTSPGGKSVYLIVGLALLAFFIFRKK